MNCGKKGEIITSLFSASFCPVAVVAFFILSSSALFGQTGLSITSYRYVSQQPYTLTLWYVTYSATLTNSGDVDSGPITGIVTSLNSVVQTTGAPGTQNTLSFPAVPANGEVNSLNTFTILVSRTQTPPFAFSDLQWAFYNTMSGLSITSYQFVSQSPFSQTLSYVTYSATLTNSGDAVGPITAIVTSSNSVVQPTGAPALQNALSFPPVPANGQVNSLNTFTVLVNRTQTPPFSFSDLQWAFYNTINSCGYTITSSGAYTFSGNLSTSSSTPCITVSAVTGGAGVIINGNSYTLSNSSSSPVSLLSVQNTDVPVTYQNTTFQFTGVGNTGYAWDLVMVSNSSTASVPGVTSASNTYENGSLVCDQSSFFASNGDQFINAIAYVSCPNATLVGGNYDLSGVTAYQPAAILLAPYTVNNMNNVLIQNNTIVGNLNYVDDGIQVETPSVQGLHIRNNIISNVFDCGIEFVGVITGATVASNAVTNAGNFLVGAFYGYGDIPLQITGSTFTGNSAMGIGNHWGLFGFDPIQPELESGSQFTDNTISNNTAPSSQDESSFGGPATIFGTASGNTLINNNFGSKAYVDFYPSTGYTDGGGNICQATLPAGGVITCEQ